VEKIVKNEYFLIYVEKVRDTWSGVISIIKLTH
jgi:hypothetical protein